MVKKFMVAAREAEIPEGEARVVELEGTRIALCRVDGALYAIEDVCTHDDGPLGEGYLDGPEIECPRHGARFDVRTGAVRSMPAVTPVKTFPLRVERGEVLVEIDAED